MTGSQEISLVPDEINTCQICFGSIPVVFITLNAAGAENLRKRLKLSAHSDPTYSPIGSGNDKLHLLHCFSHFASLMQCSEGLFLCSAILEIV